MRDRLNRLNRTSSALFARRLPRFAAAFFSGAALSLTLPPASFWPGLFAYAGLLGVLLAAERDRRRPWERLWLGATFGFAFHLFGLWWVGMAFLVDTASHGALLPLGVVGLPLLLAPFHAVAAWLAGFSRVAVAPRACALVAAIALTEALRGILFTGFPWNVPAAQMGASLTLAQGTALVGLEAMAIPAVAIGIAPAFLWARGWRRVAGLGAALLIAGGLWGYGAIRLAAPPIIPDDAPLVRIVQPNIAQADKWKPGERTRIWSTLLALTEAPGAAAAPPSLVVWPETAIPFLYRPRSLEQAQLSFALGDEAMLLAGAVEVEGAGDAREATNSVYVIDADGIPLARYDKVRLVPFGEYLPFRDVLGALGLRRLVAGSSEFRAGERAAVLATPAGPVQPLICYEIIFPRFAPDGDEPVRFLANLTNDAWFGATPGPYQHLRLARLRAIASGIPVVRAANTGVSAVIDSRGRLVASRALGTAGVLDAAVPAVERSVASRGGVWFGFAFWVIVACLGWAWQPRERTRLN